MKTGSEARNTLSEGPMAGLEEERVKQMFPDTYAAATIDGRAASAGTAMGWAVVVRSEEDMQRVREGAVIVSPNASRALIAVMHKACAVVTEEGGIGATAFWYAREYDIPAVTGVAGFTEVVSDGDLLQVDGTNGTVEIMRRKAPRSGR